MCLNFACMFQMTLMHYISLWVCLFLRSILKFHENVNTILSRNSSSVPELCLEPHLQEKGGLQVIESGFPAYIFELESVSLYF